MKGKKTAIFIHGGAIKGAFAAGVLYQLSKLGTRSADLIIGVSSGAATASYFTSGQFESMKDIWKEEVTSKNLARYSDILGGKPVFNLAYLIQEVFGKKYPLDTEAMLGASSELRIPLCNYEEKAIELFSSREPVMQTEFWNILRAAMTMHETQIQWDTTWQPYVDADLDPFALYRRELIPEEWNVLIIINHHKLGNTLRKRAGLRLFLLLQARRFPKEIREMLMRRNAYIESGMKCFDAFVRRYDPVVIRPAAGTALNPLSVAERSSARLARLFESGERAARESVPRLASFIERSAELG